MSVRNDGGPAFPCDMSFSDGRLQGAQTGPHSGIVPGISVRDYFAAAALQGLLANPTPDTGLKNWQSHFAGLAYQYADAMLAARDSK